MGAVDAVLRAEAVCSMLLSNPVLVAPVAYGVRGTFPIVALGLSAEQYAELDPERTAWRMMTKPFYSTDNALVRPHPTTRKLQTVFKTKGSDGTVMRRDVLLLENQSAFVSPSIPTHGTSPVSVRITASSTDEPPPSISDLTVALLDEENRSVAKTHTVANLDGGGLEVHMTLVEGAANYKVCVSRESNSSARVQFTISVAHQPLFRDDTVWICAFLRRWDHVLSRAKHGKPAFKFRDIEDIVAACIRARGKSNDVDTTHTILGGSVPQVMGATELNEVLADSRSHLRANMKDRDGVLLVDPTDDGLHFLDRSTLSPQRLTPAQALRIVTRLMPGGSDSGATARSRAERASRRSESRDKELAQAAADGEGSESDSGAGEEGADSDEGDGETEAETDESE